MLRKVLSLEEVLMITIFLQSPENIFHVVDSLLADIFFGFLSEGESLLTMENSMELLLGHSPIHMAEQLFKDDPQDGDALIDISEDSHIFFGQQEHNPVE